MGIVVAMGLPTLSACRLGVRGSDRDPIVGALARCDAIVAGPWEGLGNTIAPAGAADDALSGALKALDAHLLCLLVLHEANQADARVSAGIARALYTRSLTAAQPNRDDLYTARSWALRCVAQRAGVAARLAQTGGRITRWVVAIVPAEDARCLAWGAIAWSEWLHQRGVVGAALDLDAVEALGQRAVELAPDLDRGLSHLALGLSLGIRPTVLGRDSEAAAADLNLVDPRASVGLVAAVAMAELVYAPTGEASAWQRTLTAVAEARPGTEGLGALQEAGARRRARELLSAGFPRKSRW